MKNYKKDFPIYKNNKNFVYLDSASTSQKPRVVIDAISEFYQTYNANIHRGLYPIAERATHRVEEVRKKIAKFIHAQFSEEIIFTHGTTEAINLIMYSWGKQYVAGSDVVLTTVMEHHANFVPWQELCKEKGAKFKVVDITDDGMLNIEQVMHLCKDAKIFALSHVSNMLGTVTDVKKIIKKIRQVNKNIIIIVDAAQSVLHLPIDVQDLDCDFLVFSGHKMFAETGVGVLYGKKSLLENMQPFLFGGDMIREVTIEKTTFATIPNKFEAGTVHIAGIISIGAAITYIEKIGMDAIRRHERDLITYCMKHMEMIEGLKIYGSTDISKRSGIISFTIEGAHAHDIAQILAGMGICVRSGHHCAMPLHKRLGISASSRVSFHIYNDRNDIDILIKGVKKIKETFTI